jgi:hypothetical protein
MDGINKVLPMSGEYEKQVNEAKQISLFDIFANNTSECINEIQKQRIYAKVAEWHRDGENNHGVCYFKDIK